VMRPLGPPVPVPGPPPQQQRWQERKQQRCTTPPSSLGRRPRTAGSGWAAQLAAPPPLPSKGSPRSRRKRRSSRHFHLRHSGGLSTRTAKIMDGPTDSTTPSVPHRRAPVLDARRRRALFRSVRPSPTVAVSWVLAKAMQLSCLTLRERS